jgi:hypothetical protein
MQNVLRLKIDLHVLGAEEKVGGCFAGDPYLDTDRLRIPYKPTKA